MQTTARVSTSTRRHFSQVVGVMSLVWLCALGCKAQPTAATPADTKVLVIVHPDNPVQTLQSHELRQIFLRKQQSWAASGAKIHAVDLPPQDTSREVFSQAVFDESTAALRKRWISSTLRGGDRPPAIRTASQVLELVARNRSAIGYIPARMLTDKVKVIRTLRKR